MDSSLHMAVAVGLAFLSGCAPKEAPMASVAPNSLASKAGDTIEVADGTDSSPQGNSESSEAVVKSAQKHGANDESTQLSETSESIFEGYNSAEEESIAEEVKKGAVKSRRKSKSPERRKSTSRPFFKSADLQECAPDLTILVDTAREQSPIEWFDIEWSEGPLSDGYEDESNVLPVLRGSKEEGSKRYPAVLKYRSNCNYRSGANSLIKNDEMMSILEPLGVTVKSHFLSPETIIAKGSVSMRGLVFPGGLKSCIGSTVRFQVMDRFGQSIRDRIRADSKPFSLGDALRIARLVLELVTKMHDAEIVHGDISWSNVLIDDKLRNVRLIDFDRSRKVGSANDYVAHIPAFREHMNARELSGSVESVNFIDDIYALYELIGAMTKGDALYMEMRMSGDDLAAYKKKTRYIDLKEKEAGCDFHTAVHSLKPNVPPNHESLKACMNRMIALINRTKK